MNKWAYSSDSRYRAFTGASRSSTTWAYTTPVVGKAARFRFCRFDVRVVLGGAVGRRASRLMSSADAWLLRPLARANASAPDAAPDVRLL